MKHFHDNGPANNSTKVYTRLNGAAAPRRRSYGKPKNRKALCMLLAVLFIVGLFPGRFAPKALAAAGDKWDLYNFVTGISIKDANGKTVTSGSFIYGDSYTFSIIFAESTGNQLAYKSGTGKLHYELPDIIQIDAPLGDEIKLANGKVVGWYTIDTGGNIEVWFGNYDNQGNEISVNFIDRYENVKFTLDIEALFVKGTKTGSYQFGTGAWITINSIKETPVAGLRVAKGATAFNRLTESIDFTIVATAIGGPVDQIKLEDSMRISGTTTYAITQDDVINKAGVSFTYQVNNSGTWLPITPTWTGTTMVFDFGSLSLAKDQNVTLKYTMPFGGVLENLMMSGKIQRLAYSLTLNNTVTAKGNDKSTNQPVSDTTQTYTTISKVFMTKRGSATRIGTENNSITWTATVGDGIGDKLNGLKIKDELPASPLQTIDGSIQVKLYGMAKNLLASLTLNPAGGQGMSDYTPTGGFTYTVPTTPDNIYYVEFVYNTLAPYNTNSVTYYNYIYVDESYVRGSVSIAPGTVAAPKLGPKGKTSEWVWSDDGKTPMALKYTINVTVPAGNKGQMFYLIDEMYISFLQSKNSNGSLNFQLRYLQIPRDNISASIYPDDPEFYISTDYSSVRTDNILSSAYNSHYFIDMRFSNNSSLANNYQAISTWPYDDERTITVTYEIPLDAALNVYTVSTPTNPISQGTMTLREWFDLDASLSKFRGNYFNPNNAFVNNYVYFCWSTSPSIETAATVDGPPIYKKAELIAPNTSVFDYTVYLRNDDNIDNQETVRAALFTVGTPAIFEDSFDPRLEYVPGSLYVISATTSFSNNELKTLYSYKANACAPHSGNIGDYITETTEWTDSPYFIVDNENGTLWMDMSQFQAIDWPAKTIRTAVSNWYANNQVYEVHYQLRVKQEILDEYSLHPDELGFTAINTATVYPTIAKYAGGPWSASAEVTYNPGIITKNIKQTDGNIVSVEIVANNDGAQLVTGGDPDRFTLVDKMSGDLSFYLTTIKIETQTEDSGSWDGVWIDAPSPGAAGDLWSWSYSGENTVEFIVPDKTPVRITYQAQISVPVGGSATFSNEVSVFGFSDMFGKDNYIVKNSSAGVSAADLPILLFKEDPVTKAALSGAEFQLWVSRPGNGAPDYYLEYDKTTPSLTIGGRTFYHILDSDDEGNGTYYFEDTLHGLLYGESESIFMIVETKQPDNYKPPLSPNDRMFFVFNPKLDISLLTNSLGQHIDIVADNIYWKNEKQTTSATIKGHKLVTGNNIPAGTSFTFVLRQLADGTFGNYLPGGLLRYAYVDDVTKDGAYVFEFDPIENLESGETYWFELYEVDNGASNWTYDTAKRLIKVEVDGDTASISYATGIDVFKNDYDEFYGKEYEFTIHKVDRFGSPLPNAAFTVYYDEACTSIMLNNSDVLSKAGTGEVQFKGLIGNTYYYVKETAVPAQYLENPVKYRFKLDVYGVGVLEEFDGSAWIPVTDNTVINEPVTFTYVLHKIGDLPEHLAGLPDAEFSVYTDDACSNKLGSYMSDASGNVNIGGLFAGDFYIKETHAPPPYQMDGTLYKLTVTVVSGSPVFELTVEATGVTATLPLINKSYTYGFEFVKKGEVSIPGTGFARDALPDVEFALYYDSDCTELVPVMTATSGTDGHTQFSDVQPGTYYMAETSVPMQYEDDAVYVVELSYSGEAAFSRLDDPDNTMNLVQQAGGYWELTNLLKRYSFSFEKRFNDESNFIVNEGNTTPAVYGDVTYGLFYDEGGLSPVRDLNGDPMQAISAGDGTVTFDSLPPGIYYAIETGISGVYSKTHNMSSDVIKAVIDANGDADLTIDGDSFTFVSNPLKYGYCEVQKVDQKGNGILGVVLGGYRDPEPHNGTVHPTATETSLLKFTTDINGMVYAFDETGVLGEPGSAVLTAEFYWFRELDGPPGYDIDTATWYRVKRQDNPNYNVSVEPDDPLYDPWEYVYQLQDASGNDIQYIVNPRQTSGAIKFTKLDAETDDPIDGAKFTLYEDAACTVTFDSATSAGGGVITFTGLLYGQTYFLKETKAATDYMPSGTIYAVSWWGQDSASKDIVLMSPVNGSASKEDMESLTIHNYKLAYDFPIFKYGEGAAVNGLADVTFELSKSSFSTLSGTTTSTGIIWFRNVPPGTYTLTEIAHPSGYIAVGPWTVNIDVDGTVTIGTMTYYQGASPEKTLALQNTKAAYTVSFKKVDDNNAALEGAVFGLYYDMSCTNPAYAPVPSDPSGNVEFTVVSDTYYLKEISPPPKFAYSGDVYKIVVDSAGSYQIELLSNNQTDGINHDIITNSPITASLYFMKTDREETRLTGANVGMKNVEFELYDNGNNLISTISSDIDGWVHLTHLEPGEAYTLLETAAPEGYISAAGTTYTVEVSLDGTAVLKRTASGVTSAVTTVENSRKTTTFSFNKVSDSGAALEGAWFTLYDNAAATISSRRVAQATVKSDENGIVTFSDVPWGTYYLKEVLAPARYRASASIWKVVIEYDSSSDTMTITIGDKPISEFTVTNTYVTQDYYGGGDVETPTPEPEPEPEDEPPEDEDIIEEEPPEDEPLPITRLTELEREEEASTRQQPTMASEENTLEEDEDGTWIEYDRFGTPLGRWTWDNDLNDWVFIEFPAPPLTEFDMPKTGAGEPPPLYLAVLGLALISVGISVRTRRSRLRKR